MSGEEETHDLDEEPIEDLEAPAADLGDIDGGFGDDDPGCNFTEARGTGFCTPESEPEDACAPPCGNTLASDPVLCAPLPVPDPFPDPELT
jgi:hypothetical protein